MNERLEHGDERAAVSRAAEPQLPVERKGQRRVEAAHFAKRLGAEEHRRAADEVAAQEQAEELRRIGAGSLAGEAVLEALGRSGQCVALAVDRGGCAVCERRSRGALEGGDERLQPARGVDVVLVGDGEVRRLHQARSVREVGGESNPLRVADHLEARSGGRRCEGDRVVCRGVVDDQEGDVRQRLRQKRTNQGDDVRRPVAARDRNRRGGGGHDRSRPVALAGVKARGGGGAGAVAILRVVTTPCEAEKK